MKSTFAAPRQRKLDTCRSRTCGGFASFGDRWLKDSSHPATAMYAVRYSTVFTGEQGMEALNQRSMMSAVSSASVVHLLSPKVSSGPMVLYERGFSLLNVAETT